MLLCCREVQDKVQSLQQQLTDTQAELGGLQQQYNLGEKRLVRASKLISALGDEAGRWGTAADNLLTRLNLLVGTLARQGQDVQHLVEPVGHSSDNCHANLCQLAQGAYTFLTSHNLLVRELSWQACGTEAAD